MASSAPCLTPSRSAATEAISVVVRLDNYGPGGLGIAACEYAAYTLLLRARTTFPKPRAQVRFLSGASPPKSCAENDFGDE
jgi:hypothetical protein